MMKRTCRDSGVSLFSLFCLGSLFVRLPESERPRLMKRVLLGGLIFFVFLVICSLRA